MGTLRAESRNLQVHVSPAQGGATAVLSHRQKFERFITASEVAADFLTVAFTVLSCWIAYHFLGLGKHLHYNLNQMLVASVAFALLFVFLMDRDGAYEPANSLLRIRETERILRISIITFGLFFLSTIMFAHLVSRAIVSCAFFAVPVALTMQKQLLFLLVRGLHARGHGIQNVLIYGAGETGKSLFSALVRSPKLGLRPIAVVDDNPDLAGQRIHESGYRRKNSLTILRGPVTSEMLLRMQASLVLVGIPSLPADRLSAVAQEAFSVGSAVSFVPHTGNSPETVVPEYADLDGVLVASLAPPSERPWYDMCKRFFDVVAASALIILAAPAWLLIAALVKLDSRGPVLFRQSRIGLNGVPFDILKFRSMRVDCPKYEYHPTDARDSRITRTGRWLRRTSLDELPQLLNVLYGQMSLVGPRPEMPFIVAEYDARQRQRLQVLPGITGLWQISADRASLIHENLQFDMYYIRHRSFFLDLALLLHTAMFAARGT
jgi:exopolysaccharide biosynthesis polyprenyl glycosylphosphotransferase